MACINETIAILKDEIASLKVTLSKKEQQLKELEKEVGSPKDEQQGCNITKRDVERYSRQMILSQVGKDGQLKLKQLSVLVIGVGGLGCPAALYLAGAGVGRIGLVDYDVVEENNLHRQLLHNEDQLGKPKVVSAACALKKINSQLVVDQFPTQLNSSNVLEIVREYNIVVDASDNVATRYLVSDACVLTGRSLVSGSALRLEGQLTVYNHSGGPCYRCLYPQPPPPHMVTNCSDAGVLGAVPGVIGTLQALEVVKIALGMEGVLSSRLMLFDGETSLFRSVNLRHKSDNCAVCGASPTVTELIDYEQFCGAPANDKDLSLLRESERLSADQLDSAIKAAVPLVVVDVRQQAEYQMCSIPGSVNIPLQSLEKSIDHLIGLGLTKGETARVVVCMVCRRGNDSQLAVRKLQPLLTDTRLWPVDLKGGLHSWAAKVDPQFPIY